MYTKFYKMKIKSLEIPHYIRYKKWMLVPNMKSLEDPNIPNFKSKVTPSLHSRKVICCFVRTNVTH